MFNKDVGKILDILTVLESMSNFFILNGNIWERTMMKIK